MTLPSALRAASAALLLAVAIVLAATDEEGATLLLTGPDDVESLARALVAPSPPDRIAWEGRGGPTAGAALLLAPGPATPALTLPVGPLPRLRADGPARPVAERAAAIDVEVRGAVGESVVVRWRAAVGDGDSTAVVVDATGRARAGLGVRPGRAGWQQWVVSAGADSVTVGAWTLPARTLRVHALIGTPDAESRFALRALEEAGVEAVATVELGRLGIEPPTPEPTTVDVVLLLGDPELDAVTRARLDAFVASGGGAVIAPGPDGIALDSSADALLAAWGLGADARPVGTLGPGDSVAWSLPAALSPLPPAPVPVAVAARAPGAGGRAVASIDGRAVALLSTPGMGRVAWTGISESWRWRMEGGAVEAHRAWWRGLVEWAASGVRDPIVAHVPGVVVPGTVVTVRLESLRPDDARWPDEVALTRPDGRVEGLPVVPAALPAPAVSGHGSTRFARFLADTPGVHRISWEGGVETGLLVDSAAAAPGPDALSILTLASASSDGPGRPLPATADRAAAGGVEAHRPWPADGHRPPPAALGWLVALLLLAEWALRRGSGGP